MKLSKFSKEELKLMYSDVEHLYSNLEDNLSKLGRSTLTDQRALKMYKKRLKELDNEIKKRS